MTGAAERIASIDALRGGVMVLMALDHARDFLSNATGFDPRDLVSAADPALAFTRWITHVCAPVFFLLAGVAAHLATRGGEARTRTRFLITRGLWLVLLEGAVVSFGWSMHHDPSRYLLAVIAALGVAMIALAGLAYLPRVAIALVGGAIVVGHNLLDGVAGGPLWTILHGPPGTLQLGGGFEVKVTYAVLPWIGVMALGYAAGPAFDRRDPRRAGRLLLGGAVLTAAFVLLRALDAYGDPASWSRQGDALMTLFSFLDCEKYPPSLLFLLMTLGPAIVVLGLLERRRGPPGRLGSALIVFGRVPLFFYLLHLPLLQLVTYGLLVAEHGAAALALHAWRERPPGFGLSLPLVYAVWIGVVAALYPACRWFAGLKRRRRDLWILRYL